MSHYRVKVGLLSMVMILLLLIMTQQKVELMAKNKPMLYRQASEATEISGRIMKEEKMMKILYWIPFRQFADYSFGIGNAPFVQGGCKVSNCIATSSRDDLKDADAVMFHIADFWMTPQDIPKIRLPHQKYVFFVRESPVHSHLKMNKFNNFFNISMTYTQDSDVNFPYGIIERRAKEVPLPYNENIFRKKTKFAVAFISNCGAQSKRLTLIKALQKYIPITIYGACADKHSNTTHDQQCAESYDRECSRRIISNYKFYFAFENSLCRDYITEKLYKVLDQPVVPVVYGGGNYSKLLPKNSYINVQDFKNIPSLVDHLKTVASDAEKYLSYFKWRKEYKQVAKIRFIETPNKRHDFLQLEPRVMCNLCEYLHAHRTQSKSIANLPAFWGVTTNQNCVNPGPWLERFMKE